MDLEASVVERLQKLRQWQLEQQERLLKQQQIQREMLTQRQGCIYKALELSIQEFDLNEDILDTNTSNETTEAIEIKNKNLNTLHESHTEENCAQLLNNNESCINANTSNSFESITSQKQTPKEKFTKDINTKSHIKRQSNNKIMPGTKNEFKLIITSPKEEKQEQFIIDGIAPLPPDKTVINHISIDDIPIPSPKKDFHTLLEEKLRDSEILSSGRLSTNSGNKIKKPFLKKGEGLSRFKLNQQSPISTPKARPRSVSFTNTQSNSKYCKNENKSNKAAQNSKNAQLLKNTHGTSIAGKHLCLKNVPLPKKRVRSKSESNTSTTQLKNCVKNPAELHNSDFHSGTQKELEEMRIFELLEEKAENSSFCSTSSAVVAFLQQSTPFKIRNAEYKTKNNGHNTRQVTPTTKLPKDRSVFHQKVMNANVFKNIMFLQDANEINTEKLNDSRHMLLRNQIQSMRDQCDFYNVPVENDNEVDVSLHVRFSEYNEYKTIGLTDTSSISTESLAAKSFSDEKVWSDSSTAETSTMETPSIPFEMSQSSATMKSKMQELNYKIQSYEDTREKSSSTTSNTGIHQHMHYKDKLDTSDSADQTLNDEESTLHDYSQDDSTPQKINSCNNFTSHNTLKKHMEKWNNKDIDECINSSDDVIVLHDQENKENLQETNETIFKSELLKNRLLELEQEINIFRKENTALSIQRKKLQTDYRNLHKEFAEKEKNFEENRKQVEDRFQEEKKKLAREKAALENRMRDSQEKTQQSKLERQEIQNLKQEIEKLAEEMNIKESRWNAAQSRHKCQMRILKMENSKLKQEVERLQSLKKSNVRNKARSGISTNTRAIHQINKQLSMHKEPQKVNDALVNDDENFVDTISVANDHNVEEKEECIYNNSKNVMNGKSQKSQTIVDSTRKRNLYESLIKEATVGLKESQFDTSENLSNIKPDLDSKFKKSSSRANIMGDNCEKSYKDCDIPVNHNNVNGNVQLNAQDDYTCFTSSTKSYLENHEKNVASILANEVPDTCIEGTPLSYQCKTDIHKQDIKQIEHDDGSIEYRFSNGNIKKVFPDQGITKLVYYNGDVRETSRDGKVKYFYASTHTWHTTMPDGLEILEFANGQIERRSQNGTVEVSFPDGSVQILESDGIEKWTLPNGTLIQILTNGEKILTLPNGQREIHTRDHKRREYPDGTIKLIYFDGTQETRYSNGRIRLKDKDGNLLRDSY